LPHFLILLCGKALAHGQERGQWKGETAPKHIWQLSQSLAGEMKKGQEHSGKPEDTGDTRAGTGAEAETGAGCQDIEQAAACFPLPAGNRTTGLRHMSWIA